METREYKVEDILQDAVDTLNGVLLPVSYGDVVAQLSRLSRNLKAVHDWFIEQQEKQKNEEEKKEDADGQEADAE